MESVVSWIQKSNAVLLKELKIEFRNRQGIYSLLVFVTGSIFLLWLSSKGDFSSSAVNAALLWLILLFAASLGIGRTFQYEEDIGTLYLVKMHVQDSCLYTGKLIFNTLLLLIVGTIAVSCTVLFLSLTVTSVSLLICSTVLGIIALASTSTFISSLVTSASGSAMLLPVLLFPLLAPMLISTVNLTVLAFDKLDPWNDAADPILVLVGYSGVAITASLLLFDSIWHD